VTEVIGQGPAMVAMWISRKRFPLEALQKLIEFDPTPLHEMEPFYKNPEPGKKMVILMPLAGNPEPGVLDAFARLYNPAEMDFKRVAFNNLSVARNALAGYWLRGPWPWALWWDGDTVPPHCDAPGYKRLCGVPDMPDVFAGVHSIYRMLKPNIPFISACYVGRSKGAPPQFSDEGDPAGAHNMVRRGPREELIVRSWVGCGFVLTHRSVFQSIISQQGDEIRVTNQGLIKRFGYEYAFFTPSDQNTPGDDIPFCNRAARAGFKPVVDLSVFAAHMGGHAYTYADYR
jgi:hypothetical protein